MLMSWFKVSIIAAGLPWDCSLLSSPLLSSPLLSYPLLSSPILSYPLLSSPLLSSPTVSYTNIVEENAPKKKREGRQQRHAKQGEGGFVNLKTLPKKCSRFFIYPVLKSQDPEKSRTLLGGFFAFRDFFWHSTQPKIMNNKNMEVDINDC